MVPVARSKFLQKLLQCDLQIMEAYRYTGRWFLGCIMNSPKSIEDVLLVGWFVACAFLKKALTELL